MDWFEKVKDFFKEIPYPLVWDGIMIIACFVTYIIGLAHTEGRWEALFGAIPLLILVVLNGWFSKWSTPKDSNAAKLFVYNALWIAGATVLMFFAYGVNRPTEGAYDHTYVMLSDISCFTMYYGLISTRLAMSWEIATDALYGRINSSVDGKTLKPKFKIIQILHYFNFIIYFFVLFLLFAIFQGAIYGSSVFSGIFFIVLLLLPLGYYIPDIMYTPGNLKHYIETKKRITDERMKQLELARRREIEEKYQRYKRMANSLRFGGTYEPGQFVGELVQEIRSPQNKAIKQLELYDYAEPYEQSPNFKINYECNPMDGNQDAYELVIKITLLNTKDYRSFSNKSSLVLDEEGLERSDEIFSNIAWEVAKNNGNIFGYLASRNLNKLKKKRNEQFEQIKKSQDNKSTDGFNNYCTILQNFIYREFSKVKVVYTKQDYETKTSERKNIVSVRCSIQGRARFGYTAK